MKLSVAGPGRASKPYASSSRAAGSRHRDPTDAVAAVPGPTSDPLGTEIGSLPINVLAIALALTGRILEADWEPS
ncbi:MAG TPA: hypothetical protein VH183_02295 [Burkholderiaceae bacterium]|jgi:hypothetical protein|nr:hypothetical protein [Burkholderiaceae bacterium]